MITPLAITLLAITTPSIPITSISIGDGAGFAFDVALPDGKTHTINVSMRHEESFLNPVLFSVPEWRAFTGCDNFEEFKRQHPQIDRFDRDFSGLSRVVLRRLPIRLNLAKLRLESGLATPAQTAEKRATFPLTLRGSEMGLDFAGKFIPFADGSMWFVPATGSAELLPSKHREERFGVGRLPWSDGTHLNVVMRQRQRKRVDVESAHPYFAFWDTITYFGDRVEVSWDPA